HIVLCLVLLRDRHLQVLRSFPTRRSSDLVAAKENVAAEQRKVRRVAAAAAHDAALHLRQIEGDAVLQQMAGQHLLLPAAHVRSRSEEHTSELQSLAYLVCRLLLEKKKSQP